MERSARRAWIGAAAVIVVSAVAAAVFFVESSRSYDPAFDTRIAKPTYSAGRPIVLYDEGHRNTQRHTGCCFLFANGAEQLTRGVPERRVPVDVTQFR